MAYGFNDDKSKADIEAIVANAIVDKVDKVAGKGLSTNDFTDALKTRLESAITTVDTAINSTSTNPVQNKVIYTALSNKVDKVSGKGLSTNDFTTAYKNKVDYSSFNTIGSTVNLRNYSSSSLYTFPYDGFVKLTSFGSGTETYVALYDARGNGIGSEYCYGLGGGADVELVFVKKGMKAYAYSGTSNNTAIFYPLASYN